MSSGAALLRRTGKALLGVAGALLALELIVYAVWFCAAHSALPAGPQGLFAVFGGGPIRVQRALVLAQSAPAQAFVVSDASVKELDAAFQLWGRPGKARVLYEPMARSTDQNAVYVGKLVRLGGFRSVILATSWYHLPRAYALMRLELAGTGVEVHPVATEEVPKGGWKEWRFRWELKKFWPSIVCWAWTRAWERFGR